MDRDRLLADVLRHLADGTAEAGREAALAAAHDGDAAAYGIAALADFWLGDFADATRHATTGLAAADDDRARGLCLAVTVLAAGGDLAAPAADDAALRDLLAAVDDAASRWWSAVRYVAAEAALVGARIRDAAELDAAGPPAGAAWAGHPFATLMWVCQARIAAFSGRIERADALLGTVRASVVPDSRLAPVVEAVAVLVRGNAGDADGIRIAAEIAAHVPARPRDFIDRGALLLLSYGAIAVYDVAAAAALAFRAGADEALSRCTLIDRAICFEMLLHAALLEEDRGAVEAWLAALADLAEHRVSAPTVQRARARVALAAGDAGTAVALLTDSIAACVADERGVEAAEGQILLARARILERDLGAASRSLRALVADSDRTGFGAVRLAAGVTLAASGRRLPPVAGAGWDGLSTREAEVARAVLAGQEVEEIAAALFLSPRTVRTHLSRVLCAFGVATRVGLLAAVSTVGSSGAGAPVLSPRQAEVAALVASGRTNQQIAGELGISVKGVEKHVGDVLLRWNAGSRFELARIWWSVA
ncbi:helix-turn-helix transcriptional regulator [Nocardioides carbamazepini]|uniref:helix-turn-helix domain-containing protein n=1 Tax=Nocardioides carbamazepini TaxID=2854259 RepID=UPI00214A48E5|nr:helix-turn-helix transcriptional regulator [Nocardioides carbamazepini]MCR1781191.1 helix-turn-helix transcriptional regulator [Nocardioides carbamazepini]